MQKFQETIDTLRKISDDLKKQGIVLEHLNTAIDELNRHHENIARIDGLTYRRSMVQIHYRLPKKDGLEDFRRSSNPFFYAFFKGFLTEFDKEGRGKLTKQPNL